MIIKSIKTISHEKMTIYYHVSWYLKVDIRVVVYNTLQMNPKLVKTFETGLLKVYKQKPKDATRKMTGSH